MGRRGYGAARLGFLILAAALAGPAAGQNGGTVGLRWNTVPTAVEYRLYWRAEGQGFDNEAPLAERTRIVRYIFCSAPYAHPQGAACFPDCTELDDTGATVCRAQIAELPTGGRLWFAVAAANEAGEGPLGQLDRAGNPVYKDYLAPAAVPWVELAD